MKTPRWIGDLESNGLLGQDPWMPKADTVWMFAAWDTKMSQMFVYINDKYLTEEVEDYISGDELPSKLWKYYDPEDSDIKLYPLSKLKSHLSKFAKKRQQLCMHNMIKYDKIILRDLLDIDLPWDCCRDTLVLSKLSDADRFPGHGLAAWGEKFGVPKPEHEEWDKFSIDMINRLIMDVVINVLTWHSLHKELTDPKEKMAGVDWAEAIELEHQVAHIVAECEKLGFPFDLKKAKKSYKRMKKHLNKLDKEIGFSETFLTSRQGTAVSSKDFMKKFGQICDLNFSEWSHFLKGKEEEDSRKGYGVPVTRIFKKDGTYQSLVAKFWVSDPILDAVGPYSLIETRETLPEIAGPYTRVEYNPVNPKSTGQMIRMLQCFGWEADEWTEKGSPKISDSSLDKFVKNRPEFENLKDRIVTQARMTMMKNDKDDQKGLINLVLDNGTIPSINDQIGALTHRSKHKKIVNIPGNSARWGQLFRKSFHSLPWDGKGSFTFERPEYDKNGNPVKDDDGKQVYTTQKVKGKMALIGCDAQALEARLLGAFMGDDKFTDEVLNGDIHTVFWDTVRDLSSSRGNTKGMEYAFIFGAAAPKLGTMVDMGRDIVKESDAKSKKWKKLDNGLWTDEYRQRKGMEPISFERVKDAILGNMVINRFMKGLPALQKLVDSLKGFAKSYGFIIGLDGRRYKVRKAHAVLNLKIQSSGAIVMKRALVMAYERFKEAGIPWYLHCYYHDEFQISCPPKHVKEACHILEQSIRDAGDFYNLACPMDAKADIGLNWSDTH